MRSTRSYWVVTLTVLSLGCSIGLPDTDGHDGYDVAGKIRTSSNEYVVVRDNSIPSLPVDVISIGYSITNETGSNLYIEKCIEGSIETAVPQPRLVKYQDGNWTIALGAVCVLVYIDPIVVGPGETFSGTGTLTSNLADNVGPRFSPEIDSIAGVYKLELPVYRDYNPDQMRLAAMEYRLSNEFRLDEER